jgi:hypothetical protein
MRLLIAALMILLSWPAQAYLIPLNGTEEIVGPWASNPIVTGYVFLSASATIAPLDPTNPASFSGYAVYTNLTVPGAIIESEAVGNPAGALGDVETIGANYSTNCTSCSPSAKLFWFAAQALA